MSKWYETYSHTLLLHYRSLFLVRIITIGLVCTFFKVICKYFNVLNVGVNVFFLLFKKKKKKISEILIIERKNYWLV
jgi:hypothetical protein